MFIFSFSLRWLKGTFHDINLLMLLFSKMDCKYRAIFDYDKIFRIKQALKSSKATYKGRLTLFNPFLPPISGLFDQPLQFYDKIRD
jgi:hypothetical protein